MVSQRLERQVQFPEVLERLVAPHFLLCEDSSVVYQPECHEEGCSHVRAEFSHFSNRALVPRHASEHVCYIRIDNVWGGTEALLGHDSGIEGCPVVTLRQCCQGVLNRQQRKPLVKDKKPKKKPKPPQPPKAKENNGPKDAATASETKKGKGGATGAKDAAAASKTKKGKK